MVRIVADNMDSVLIDPALVVQINGRDGKDGERGQDGKDGRDGVDGKNGRDGRDGVDGKDGKNGVSSWIEYDAKTNTLVFKNDGGLKNPDPIKLPAAAKGWGFAAGIGRGGVTAQSDWNQTDKHAVDYIKNKPEIHNIQLRRVDSLPATGEPYILYLVPVDDPQTKNIYDEYIWAIQSDDTYDWEKLGTTEIDLSGYVKYTDVAGAGHISNKTATNKFLSPSTIDDVAAVSARSMYDNIIDVSGGTVNLSEGCVLYRSEPTADTAYTFSNSALTQTTDIPCVYFNLLVSMPSTPVSLDFTTNNTVTWVEDTPPDTSVGGKTYMLAFQSFDGGATWVGSLATWWTTP